MDWLRRRLPRTRWWWPREAAYAVPFRLFDATGDRCIEVRVRRDGFAYYVEMERADDGAYQKRAGGEEVGPFYTARDAEDAAGGSPWFNGRPAAAKPSSLVERSPRSSRTGP